MAYKVAIDPGHGGQDPGAVFEGREEKEDNLDLALAVGQLLENRGIDVVYTRMEDVYNSPYEKAVMANNADADLFVSFHRNAAQNPGAGTGAEVLVYTDRNLPAQVARNILNGLEKAGYRNNGVTERKDLVVLRRTRMPAVLIETGFIDNPQDNQIFDSQFEILAENIAEGILASIPNPAMGVNPLSTGGATGMPGADRMLGKELTGYPLWDDGEDYSPMEEVRPVYRVQAGAFREEGNANALRNELAEAGFPAFVLLKDGLYRVQVGAFNRLENAIRMERILREYGYNTYITV